jgi:hypothetical protein
MSKSRNRIRRITMTVLSSRDARVGRSMAPAFLIPMAALARPDRTVVRKLTSEARP